MSATRSLCVFLGLVLSVSCIGIGAAHTIKHVVVVMEENRSFDHILGLRKGVDGVLPVHSHYNYVNPRTKQGKVLSGDTAQQVAPCDPDHSLPATTAKIFGVSAAANNNLTDPCMCGFVEWEAKSHSDNCEVLNSLAPEAVPIINQMADEFALFDKFHASVPGPTWPNRLFFMCATSGGLTETSSPWFQEREGVLFPMRTIFDQLSEVGRTWKNYVNDTPWELFVETIAHNPENVVSMDAFYRDAREGTLPDFSFINPRIGLNMTTGLGSNDQHPDHDVSLGERFYKDIYEAVRAGPAWNDTLLIVTYDEHGGFYDHVAPPADVPAPDAYPSYPDKFDFRRGGIRIPTLLLSPWVPKGLLLSDPPAAQKPAANSVYELTSIMATVRKLFRMEHVGPLTKRDAWAATFEHVFDMLPSPRTDCPMHLREPVPPTLPPAEEARKPLNGLQVHIAKVHAHLSGVDFPHHITEQKHVSAWVQDRFRKHSDNVMQWKRSKASQEYALLCESAPVVGVNHTAVSIKWDMATKSATSAIKTVLPNNGGSWCFDSAGAAVGVPVGVSRCLASDPKQQWSLNTNLELVPVSNPGLCVTVHCIGNTNLYTRVTYESCKGTLNQHFAYEGEAPGQMDNSGAIVEGGWLYLIALDHAKVVRPREV